MIPAFLARVDQPDRGGRWIEYLAETRRALRGRRARRSSTTSTAEPRDEVTLTDFDPDGEIKVVAAALYAVSDAARRSAARDRAAACRPTIAPRCCAPTSATRANRRHKPGRAFERTSYRFDVLADYGAFRDLQRHRLLTLEWQPLSARHGYIEPAAIEEAGALDDWRAVMDASARPVRRAASRAGCATSRRTPSSMAYRVRFYMDMNAREAMHVIELRTAPQGHPSYRRVCQLMHRAIADVAGHRAIAAAMQFADHSEVELERLQSERALEKKTRERRSRLMNVERTTHRPVGSVSSVVLRPVARVLVEEGQRLERLASDRRTARRRGDRSRAG